MGKKCIDLLLLKIPFERGPFTNCKLSRIVAVFHSLFRVVRIEVLVLMDEKRDVTEDANAGLEILLQE